eukprot:ctg_29.g9
MRQTASFSLNRFASFRLVGRSTPATQRSRSMPVEVARKRAEVEWGGAVRGGRPPSETPWCRLAESRRRKRGWATSAASDFHGVLHDVVSRLSAVHVVAEDGGRRKRRKEESVTLESAEEVEGTPRSESTVVRSPAETGNAAVGSAGSARTSSDCPSPPPLELFEYAWNQYDERPDGETASPDHSLFYSYCR